MILPPSMRELWSELAIGASRHFHPVTESAGLAGSSRDSWSPVPIVI